MRTLHRTLVAAAATAAVAAAVVAPMALADDQRSPAREAIALTAENTLLALRTDGPSTAREIGPVTGLQGDGRLVGIDFRVSDGLLYGVGDGGGVYTVDDATAAAGKVGDLTVALDGALFGVDVDPDADALRIVSDTGQNLRQPLAADATTAQDPALARPVPPPGTGTRPATGVTGAAHTHGSVPTLYVIDTELERLATQTPPDAGPLAAVGDLGLRVGPRVAFDIARPLDGASTDGAAFAAVELNGQSRLVSVDLRTGAADEIGPFRYPIIGLAVRLDR